MVCVHQHPDDPMTRTPNGCAGGGEGGGGGGGGRLNLLLSYADWRSESWADRLPKLLSPMGVSTVRVGTGVEASRVIRSQPVHIAVVDLALPMDEAHADGGDLGGAEAGRGGGEAGTRLLELLRRLAEPPPTVVVHRGRTSRDAQRELNAALRAGVFAVIDRPMGAPGLELLLEVLRRCLARHYQGRWPEGPTQSS